MSWKVGLRIVDLGELARQMYCKECQTALDLNRTESERQYGLASVLRVLCLCGAANSVRTGRLLQQGGRDDVLSYDVNVKASIGMLMNSDPEKNVMNFLAVLKIPAATLKTAQAKHRAGKDQRQFPAEGASQSQGADNWENCKGQGHAVDLENCEGQGHTLDPSVSQSVDKGITEEESEKKTKVKNSPCVPELVTGVQKQKSRNTRKRKLSGVDNRQTTKRLPEISETASALNTSDPPAAQASSALQTCTDTLVQSNAEDPNEVKVKPIDTEAESSQVQISMHALQPEPFQQKPKMLTEVCDTDSENKEQESADVNLDTKSIVTPVASPELLPSVGRKNKKNNGKPLAVKAPAKTSSGKKVKVDENTAKQKSQTTARNNKKNSKKATTSTQDQQKIDSDQNPESAAAIFSPMSLRRRTKEKSANSKPKRSKTPKLSQKTEQKAVAKSPADKTEQNSCYQCPMCQKTAASSRGLATHLRQVHKDVPGKYKTVTGKNVMQNLEPVESNTEKDRTGSPAGEEDATISEGDLETGPDPPANQKSGDQQSAIHTEESHNASILTTQCSVTKKNVGSLPSRKTKARARFVCQQCDVHFLYSQEYTDHMQKQHHMHKPHQCRRCAESFQTENQLKLHRKQHSPVEECHECTICLKIFPTGRRLRAHRTTHTREERFRPLKRYCCKHCGEEFAKNYFLQIHLNYHQGKKPYQCFICAESFFTKPERRAHYKKCIAKKKSFLCELCGGRFGSVSSLRKHERVHTGEKPHKCKFCDKKFSRTNTLRIHERQHTGETPYVCDQCGSGFKQRVSLVSHMKSRHNIIATYYSQPRSGPRYTHEDYLAGKPFRTQSDPDSCADVESSVPDDSESSVIEKQEVGDLPISSAAGSDFPTMQYSAPVQNVGTFSDTNLPQQFPHATAEETNNIATLADAAGVHASASSMTQTPIYPQQFRTRLRHALQAFSSSVQISRPAKDTVPGLAPVVKIVTVPQSVNLITGQVNPVIPTNCGEKGSNPTTGNATQNSLSQTLNSNSDCVDGTVRLGDNSYVSKTLKHDFRNSQQMGLASDSRTSVLCSGESSRGITMTKGSDSIVVGAQGAGKNSNLPVEAQRDGQSQVGNTLIERGMVLNTQGVLTDTRGSRQVVLNVQQPRGLTLNKQENTGVMLNSAGSRTLVIGDGSLVLGSQGNQRIIISPEILHSMGLAADSSRTPGSQSTSSVPGTVVNSERDDEVPSNTGRHAGSDLQTLTAVSALDSLDSRERVSGADCGAGDVAVRGSERHGVSSGPRGHEDDIVTVCPNQLTSLQNVPLYYDDN